MYKRQPRAPAWIPTPQEGPPTPKFTYLASSWRSCALSWLILALLGLILSPSCSKMALSCPCRRQDLKMTNLRPFREVSCLLFGILGAEGQIAKNTEKTQRFSRFLGVLGVLLEAMFVHLGAILGYVGPAGRHLGATWRQDEAQKRQDEPRWRTGAPRRGKIGERRRRGLLQGGSNPRGGTPRTPLHPPKNGFSRMGLQKLSLIHISEPTRRS